MADVIEINDLDSLHAYRMTWNALFGQTPRASFFHTFDWLDAYWRHFGDDQRLRVMVVRAAGKPIGIVPLCVRNEQRQFGKVRVLSYPLDGWGACYSPLGGCQAATLTLAMRHIATTYRDGSARDWDLIDLPWIDDEKTDRGRTARAMESAGLRPHRQEDQTNSFIDLHDGWETYLATRGSKTRQEMRRTLRSVDQPDKGQPDRGTGRVEYVRHRPKSAAYGDGDPAWDLYEQCEEVARQSWQADSTDGNTLCHERYQPFLRAAHAAAARCGMVDVNLLKIDGQPVAFNYNYHTEGVVYGLRTGYRKDASNRSAGAALTLLTLRDSFERGDERFELGPGDQDYKQRIRTGRTASFRLTHLPLGSWKSQAVRLGRWVRARRSQPALASA